jgi:putative transposase
MPRHARTVFAGVPHHVTQRGNRGEVIFFSDEDRVAYLTWLREYCARYEVSILAYCLMSNHVHIVAVPGTEDALQKVFRPLHMRYAQRLNRAKKWKGHVWQGRYFSSALDDSYLWAALRYVERNPVRARIVQRAESYRWSSAAAHCRLQADPVLATVREWVRQLESIDDWSSWLAEGDRSEEMDVLRRYVETSLPCGDDGFVRRLEGQVGKNLRVRSRGRPKKIEHAED